MSKKILMAMFLIVVSINASSSNKLVELGFTVYSNQLYPKLGDTYALNSIDYEKYLTIATKEIERYQDNAYMYYMKGYILLGYHGFLVRKSEKENVSRGAYFSTEKSRLMVLKTQGYLIKSLDVHNAASIDNKLSRDILSSIHTKLNSPFQKEKAIKAGVSMTSLEDLEGCPADPAISDEEYECSPIANSWEEFLYQQYSNMYSVYSYLIDKNNMERIANEFEERIKSNEKNTKQVEKTIKYYLDEFNKNDKTFWRKFNNGELEGKVVDIKSIPDAYKQVPFYWKNYIVANGLEKYAQWDIKGMDSPDGIKAEKAAPVQEKIQRPVVKDKVKPVQPAKPTTPKPLFVPDNRSNDRTMYYVLGVLILLLLIVGVVRKWVVKK